MSTSKKASAKKANLSKAATTRTYDKEELRALGATIEARLVEAREGLDKAVAVFTLHAGTVEKWRATAGEEHPPQAFAKAAVSVVSALEAIRDSLCEIGWKQ